VLAGAVVAAVGLLVLPSLGPIGSVLELQGARSGRAAIAQAPTPTTSHPSPTATTHPPASALPITAADTALPAAATPLAAPAAPSALLPADDPVEIALDATLLLRRPPDVEITPLPLASLTGYHWPLAHPRLTLPFGPTPWGSRLVNGKLFHDGVDLATFCGDRVLAAHDGVVIAAGRHYDNQLGWVGDLSAYYRRLGRNHLWYELPIVVVIDDGNGYRSVYAHFSRLKVEKGDVVRAGQLLGYEGMTGHASGCHVHYSLFSPAETATFRIKPDVARRMRLPNREIARVDPLLVLPPRAGINAPRHPKDADEAKAASTSP